MLASLSVADRHIAARPLAHPAARLGRPPACPTVGSASSGNRPTPALHTVHSWPPQQAALKIRKGARNERHQSPPKEKGNAGASALSVRRLAMKLGQPESHTFARSHPERYFSRRTPLNCPPLFFVPTKRPVEVSRFVHSPLFGFFTWLRAVTAPIRPAPRAPFLAINTPFCSPPQWGACCKRTPPGR